MKEEDFSVPDFKAEIEDFGMPDIKSGDEDFGTPDFRPPTWESGDGGAATMPEGQTNQWGGNLRNEGRKVLFRRDKAGKVNGYSTTSSMLVKHADGRFAVVPTVVDGKELSPEDAVKHYSETGEHWGMADDEDHAKAMAWEVHYAHKKANQEKWNDWIHEHWDEVSDEIRNDPRMDYEHRKRTTPDSVSRLERWAFGDEIPVPKTINDNFDEKDGLSQLIDLDIDDELKLTPSQRNTLKEYVWKRRPAMLRKAISYMAQQRMREIPIEQEQKEREERALQEAQGKETGHLENVRNIFSNVGLGSLAGVHRTIGTVLGGESATNPEYRSEVMVDHPLAKKEGETFDSWYDRVRERINPKKRMAGESKEAYRRRIGSYYAIKREAEKYFEWAAPIAGKEKMHKEIRVEKGASPRDWNGGTMLGNFFLDLGGHIQDTLDEDYAVGRTGNVAVDWISNAATGIGKFSVLGAGSIPVFANDSYLNTQTMALKSGQSFEKAESLAATAGIVDGALTAAFYAAPFKRWFNSKGITPVQRVASGSFSDMSRGMGRYFAKREMLNVGVAALEAGGIMGVQGAADTAIAQLAQGQDVDLGEVTVGGLKGVRDGVLIGAVMGGARILNARIKGAKEYERIVREAIKTPEGRQALAEMNVEGMADFLEAFEKGGVADSAQADRAGLPKMSIQERGQFASRMKAQGVTSEMLRKGAADFRRRAAESFRQDPSNQLGARSGDGDIGDGHGDLSPKPPKPPTTPPEPIIDGETGEVLSPDEALARRISKEFPDAPPPKRFNLPQNADGTPQLVTMRWHENGGKADTWNENVLAYDPNTKVTIMQESDGSFSVHNNTGDSDSAANMDEAVVKAKVLALMDQYTQLDRKRKEQVIRTEAKKYGKWDTMYFPTMADAADAIDKAIERDGSYYGITNTDIFRAPDKADRDAFYISGNDADSGKHGVAFVILDNVSDTSDIPRILAHEHIGHGGPNAEFGGRKGARVEFAENIRAKEFEAFKKEIVDGLRKEVRANDMDSVNRDLAETFAHYAAANLDKEPSKLDKLVSAVNGVARKLKRRKTYSAADVRTMMAKWKAAGRGEGGIVEGRTDTPERFEFFPAEEQKTTTEVEDETGTGADEAHAQPEPGAAEPAGAEAPRPAETGEPPAQSAGVVEPRRLTSAEEVVATAKTPFSEVERKALVEAADVSAIDSTGGMPSQTDFLSILSKDAPVVRLNPAKVDRSDAVLPNMKKDANRTSGITKPLSGEWHPTMGGIGAAWLTKDGKLVVITGRHRSELAERKGKSMLYYLYREADGFTKDDALIYDAVANIHDEKGTINDYLGFLDRINPTREQAEKAGILSGKGLVAWSLYKDATEAVRSATAMDGNPGEGQISPQQATVIAQAAPRDADKRNPSIQRQLLRTALGGMRGKAFDMYARIRAEELSKTPVNVNLLVGEQMDLFSSPEDQAADILAQRQSQYRTKKAQGYQQVAQNLRSALNKEGKLELTDEYAKDLGVTDKGDKKQLESAYEKAVERANYWENTVRLDDADKAAMDTEINAAADARAKKLAELKAKREAAKSGKTTPKPKAETPKKPAESPQSSNPSVSKELEPTFGKFMSVMDGMGYGDSYRPNVGGELPDRVTRKWMKHELDNYIEMAQEEGEPLWEDVFGENKVPATVKAYNEAVALSKKLGAEIEKPNAEPPAPEPAKTAPASAPKKAEATTPPKPEKPVEGRKSASEVTSAVRVKDGVANAKRFKTGDKVSFIEELATMSSRNTASRIDAEIFAPSTEEVPDKVVVSDGEQKWMVDADLLKTPEEMNAFLSNRRKAIEKAAAESAKPAPAAPVRESRTTEKSSQVAKPRTPSIKMKNEAAEKIAQKQEDDLAALFDTLDLSEENENPAVNGALDHHNENAPRAGSASPQPKVVLNRKAKVSQGTAEIVPQPASEVKRRIQTYRNGDITVRVNDIPTLLRDLGTLFRMRYMGRSRYATYEAQIGDITFRLSDHNASGANFSRDKADKYVSVYIDVQTFPHQATPIPFTEIRFPKESYMRNARGVADAIVDGVESLIDTGDFKVDPSIGQKIEYPAEVSFDAQDFDPDLFQKRVGAVAKLVKTYQDNGVADFNTLATRMAERFPEKFDAMKPYLRGVWNAVAEQIGLTDISRGEAEKVYGTIEAKAKEASDGELEQSGQSDGNGDRPLDSVQPEQDAATAEGSAVGQGGTSGSESGTGVRVQGEAGLEGRRVGGRPGGRDSDTGGVDNGTGHGSPGERIGGHSGEGGQPSGSRGETVRDGTRRGSGGLHSDGGGRERDSQGDAERSGADVGLEPAVRVKKAAKKAADSTKPNPRLTDFTMTKAVESAIVEKNTATRVRSNIAAINLIRDLKARDYAATPAEQETLAKFVGWGGLREDVFGYELERAYDMERSGDAEAAKRFLKSRSISNPQYQLHKELRSILNDTEYESAKASASTAFYTPVEFVRILHGALRDLGVKGGRFLGPSAGTGNFASAAGEYEKPVNWQFVEKDAMTGELLKALFPNQRVTIGGFEETKFPDGFFDFAIDNVPYADVPISDRSISSRMFKIHDYFFAKTLSKLRPGGVMAFLTSTGTLDKTSPILRQYLTEHGGKIVGAVRLPNGFFSENAGTEAASDLVIVQKVDGRPDNSAFEKGVEYATTTVWVRRKGQVKKPITYNGYFQDHPEQVVGTMEVASGQFGPTLKYTMPEGETLWDRVREAVKNALAGVDSGAMLKSATVAEPKERTPIYDEEGLRQGNVTMKDGKPFIKSGDMLEPISLPNDRTLSKELAKRLKSPKSIMDGILGLRKAMRDVIDAQMSDSDTVETDLAPLLAKLNEVYDAFVKKNGSLHDKWITPFVMLDKADGNRLLALERTVKDADGKPKIVKSDIFTKRVISRGQRATKAETPKDALVISYSETGGLNVPRIAELLGVSADEAVAKLKESGDAFENPQTGRLEPSWQYLSGRVRAKLAAARAAVAAGEESYRSNVEALEKVQPPMVRLEEVAIKFGAPWVDTECMKDFLRDAFGSEHMRITLGKNEVTNDWNVEFGRVMNEDVWGETSWSAQEFIKRVLNHASMEHWVTDPVDKKRYLDERRTEANKLAAEKLHSAFSQFIQSSEKWAEPCFERYNSVMTDQVEARMPNNILPFRAAGMSEATLGKLFENGDPNKPKKGREYQSAVIARGVLGGGSLCLAHCVGAGKTLEMQSIGILGRHLGLFKKPMYVVPNHMLEQFTNEFTAAFPNANILKMSEDDVKPENRRAFFAQAANGDWDAIVVKHSTFSKKLAMSDEYQKEFLDAQRRDMEQIIEAMRDGGDKISVDKANKMLGKLTEKIDHLVNAENHDSQIVPFEELGVDQLFVDEAHNFKGLPITTRQGKIKGLQQGDSQRAEDMLMKTQYVQSLHGSDRGVVFATGTPLSNAPVLEAYVMLKYLAPRKLEEQGLTRFDDFVDSFGRITRETVPDESGKSFKEQDMITSWVNIPEMMKLFKSAVDIVNPDQLDIPRPKPKYHMIGVDMSPAQEAIMEMVAREVLVPGGKERPSKMMDLGAIAKLACLSPRLLGYEDGGNKIIRAVSEIKKMYDETSGNHGAQLVFTDIFNMSEKRRDLADGFINYEGEAGKFRTALKHRKGSFNLNEEIRDLLVTAGIPKSEIAIIHDLEKSKGDKDENKEALFAKVRNGEVRILIGSRPRMGEGTNVQERLAAIHLLHPGWKPAEDEQAIGRIIRYGNMYKEGQIFYYFTQGNDKVGSYEMKNHDLIGRKSKINDQIMHGDDSLRESESVLDRDILMSLASGNKALMELIDVKKRVHKLELNTESTLTSARRNKDRAEANARILERRREEFEKEQEGVSEWREKNDGKPFVLSTPDGRTIEKVKDMADYVAAQMVKQLTLDRYDREDRFVLGNFNGVEMVLTYDKWGDEKFRLSVPLLGVAREINYSGFIPDFSTGAMTVFKNKISDTVSPEYAQAYKNSLADMDRQAKKMLADADRLQKEYEDMRGELIKLRARQAELERAVTPLMVQAVEDRSVAAYGNWSITKQTVDVGFGLGYIATRESDGKNLSAPTVKELLPLMDAEDFASPAKAATKTADIHPRANAKGEAPRVDRMPVGEVDFDTPTLSSSEKEYAENAAEMRPIEDDEKIGFTKADTAHARKVFGMAPLTHTVRTDAERHRMADALLSREGYGEKLVRAVAKFGRPLFDYEQTAVGKVRAQMVVAANDAKKKVDALQSVYDEFNAIPKDERDTDTEKEISDTLEALKDAKAGLRAALARLDVADNANDKAGTELGRGLRARQDAVKLPDLSYAGIIREVAKKFGGSEKIPQELIPVVEEAAREFEKANDLQKKVIAAQFQKSLDTALGLAKKAVSTRKMIERKPGDEAKHVEKGYIDALTQFMVGANETGGTLIGLADQKQPGWGKWLRQLAEYHCFMNPDIKVDEVVAKMIEDLKECGMDAVDEVQVWEAWTGYGHNFRQSRFESQRRANWLKSQALHKKQLQHMNETNTLPEATGLIRDEDPTPEGRELRKEVYDRKKEVPDAERDERHLKGILDTIRRRLENDIADLERAIATGEQIPPRNRTVREDIDIREKRKRKAELREIYDKMFGTKHTLTPEQKIAIAEKAMSRILERDLEDIARAEQGDFSKIEGHPTVNDRYVRTLETNLGKKRKTDSPTLQVLREKHLENVKKMLELKKAKYEYGMTPEEIAERDAKKLANLDKLIEKYAEMFATGDLRRNVTRQPPMSPENQKLFDEKERQVKKAREKLAQLRLDAENATAPRWLLKGARALGFGVTAQRALRATMDFSAVLRQAARLSLGHPVKAARAFGKAWSSMRSETDLASVNDEIMSDPTVQEGVKKYGLHLREVDAIKARDVEMFYGMERNKIRIGGKEYAITDIPFFGQLMLKSERHYITYLNAMSAELYSSIVNDTKRFPGGITPWQKKMVADMINVWNGSAALSKERRQAMQKAWYNHIFWAPALAISRIQSVAQYDVFWHPLTAKGIKNEDGTFDQVSAKERATMIKVGVSEKVKSTLAMIAVGMLLRWLLWDDDDDYAFKEADLFEKFMMLASPKVGNTTIDLTGGENSVMRTAYKIFKLATAGEAKTGTGRTVKSGSVGGPSIAGTIGRFAQGKFAPWLSELIAIAEGRDFVGDEYTVGKAVKDAIMPLGVDDISDQFQQNGVGKSLLTIPFTLLGAGGSTYDRKPYENAVNRFLEAMKEYDSIEADELLDEDTRKMLLENIRSGNPLMRDGVREDIAADITRVRKDEARVRRDEKKGFEQDDALLSDIEREKAAIIEKIRSKRK